MFDDTRLVQHYPGQLRHIELVDALIIGNRDARERFRLPQMAHRNAHRRAFLRGLIRHRERCQNQHGAVGMLRHGVGPSELHSRLT